VRERERERERLYCEGGTDLHFIRIYRPRNKGSRTQKKETENIRATAFYVNMERGSYLASAMLSSQGSREEMCVGWCWIVGFLKMRVKILSIVHVGTLNKRLGILI
jgi:hypothetical protein